MSTNSKSATWTSAKSSLSILAVSVALSLFTTAYENSVIPLFASVPTLKYLSYVVHTSTAVAVITPNLSSSKILLILGCLLLLAPHTSYWISVHAARFKDPIYSPLVTHALVLAPVVYFSVSLAMSVDPTLALIVLAANALQLRPLLMLAFSALSLDAFRNNVIFTALGCVCLAVYGGITVDVGRHRANPNARNTRSTVALTAIPVILTVLSSLNPALRSPTLVNSIVTPYNSPTYPLRILNSTQSKTGVVVVGEILPPADRSSIPLHSIRYLRVSHSLLGGVWIGDLVATLDGFLPLTDQYNTPLGDSIYSAFVLQEAVRLVNSTPKGRKGEWSNALIIGLGTGISANAFAQHGIATTIVEIDPAVYDAARQYFGLSDPGNNNVFLQDARGWVRRRRAMVEAEDPSAIQYDFVVHDCFSGGGVPEHLFSIEFWDDLKTILSPEGVVAVNFAGKIASDSSQAILVTLMRAFGQCRAFHDHVEPISSEQLHSQFVNIVFFCSPSPTPLTFRPAVEEDYLHSYLRRHILSSLDKREIHHPQIGDSSIWSATTEEKFVLTDAHNTLNTWQEGEALDHWKLMREMVPDVVWETY
ncbi:S-adenosyl-L-methionine-dependent methyltransferase [Suillus bovinus]|uniref:S-adenosyl-L-methionine-dependent methyltransferase n=1 Tax=Suillus bovinus TaxID=48563 RepID=UPI001B867F25|nr:S-adenosyl-L-methionine-dependent methyltransferase [Suillus bovinus]KAG2154997.1 S-adenosyl-L-methionine-dependent methyltransferase [Suillus bovinus]